MVGPLADPVVTVQDEDLGPLRTAIGIGGPVAEPDAQPVLEDDEARVASMERVGQRARQLLAAIHVPGHEVDEGRRQRAGQLIVEDVDAHRRVGEGVGPVIGHRRGGGGRRGPGDGCRGCDRRGRGGHRTGDEQADDDGQQDQALPATPGDEPSRPAADRRWTRRARPRWQHTPALPTVSRRSRRPRGPRPGGTGWVCRA